MGESKDTFVGVKRKKDRGGRYVYMAYAKGKPLGYFKDAKTAAKTYDMFVIKNRLSLETNFIKKIVAK